jgi:hypothetical protein
MSYWNPTYHVRFGLLDGKPVQVEQALPLRDELARLLLRWIDGQTEWQAADEVLELLHDRGLL